MEFCEKKFFLFLNSEKFTLIDLFLIDYAKLFQHVFFSVSNPQNLYILWIILDLGNNSIENKNDLLAKKVRSSSIVGGPAGLIIVRGTDGLGIGGGRGGGMGLGFGGSIGGGGVAMVRPSGFIWRKKIEWVSPRKRGMIEIQLLNRLLWLFLMKNGEIVNFYHFPAVSAYFKWKKPFSWRNPRYSAGHKHKNKILRIPKKNFFSVSKLFHFLSNFPIFQSFVYILIKNTINYFNRYLGTTKIQKQSTLKRLKKIKYSQFFNELWIMWIKYYSL